MLQLLDAAAQTVDIEHPLHRGQGGVKGGDVGLTVRFHSRPGYRRLARGSAQVTTGRAGLASSTIVHAHAARDSPCAQPGTNRRFEHASHTMSPSSAPGRRVSSPRHRCWRRPTRPRRSTWPSTCWKCCRHRGVWCAPASRPTTRRSSRSASNSRRPPRTPASASSATWMVGEHVEPGELAERYDAVIYAVGAQSDRPLNIPGEDLPGSVAAVDFVGWYNAHPNFEEMAPDLAGRARRCHWQRQRRARRRAHSGHRPRARWRPPISPTTRWNRCAPAGSRKW